MAEGNAYEDESDLPQKRKQKQGTGSDSAVASPAKQFRIKERYDWSEAELNRLVQDGALREDSTTLQHVALHPYWLTNPLKGVEEELGDSLGKRISSLNGYVVAVKNIRMVKRKPSRHSQVGFMYQDQPWVHVDAAAKFYLYTPVVGQKVTGTIMKFGAKAVICVIFKCFSASVCPDREEELSTWSLGDELPFEITFVQDRRKGPVIRAKSISTPVPPRNTTVVDTAGPDEGDGWSSVSPTKQRNREVTEFGEPEVSSKKKKKKHRERAEYDESQQNHEISDIKLESDYLAEEARRSSRKHKHKDKRRSSIEPTPEDHDYDYDQQSYKKRKRKDKQGLPDSDSQDYYDQDQEIKVSKKHRTPDAIVPDVIEPSDDLSVTKKKRKKHG